MEKFYDKITILKRLHLCKEFNFYIYLYFKIMCVHDGTCTFHAHYLKNEIFSIERFFFTNMFIDLVIDFVASYITSI
jgi:hypothetical protein